MSSRQIRSNRYSSAPTKPNDTIQSSHDKIAIYAFLTYPRGLHSRGTLHKIHIRLRGQVRSGAVLEWLLSFWLGHRPNCCEAIVLVVLLFCSVPTHGRPHPRSTAVGLSNYDYIIFFAILYCNHIHKSTPQTILYSSSNVLYCNWYVLIINHNINILIRKSNPPPKPFFNHS